MLQVSIYRYNPETDSEPYMQDLEVDTGGKDLMVLDVLELIKAQDPTVAFRRSCREGVCGSDGLNMNGKNGLACICPLSETVKNNKLIVRPLPGLPVVRDLVVDMSLFYQQYEKIEPYLQNDTPAPAIERLQSPEEREKLDGLYECILCACRRVFDGATKMRRLGWVRVYWKSGRELRQLTKQLRPVRQNVPKRIGCRILPGGQGRAIAEVRGAQLLRWRVLRWRK